VPQSAKRSTAITCVALTYLLCLSAYARAAAPPSLSDRDAAGLISSWFAGAGFTQMVRIGNLIVTREDPSCSGSDFDRGRISEREYATDRAWAAAGLVKITGTEIAPDAQSALAPIVGASCARLALRRISLTPTKAGLALDVRTPITGVRDARFLYARTYSADVARIVDNSELKQAAELYRVVKCIVRFRYSPLGRTLARLELGQAPPAQKQIVLIRYDEFETRWSLVTSDAAGFNSDFKTDRVADYLLQHG